MRLPGAAVDRNKVINQAHREFGGAAKLDRQGGAPWRRPKSFGIGVAIPISTSTLLLALDGISGLGDTRLWLPHHTAVENTLNIVGYGHLVTV